METAFIPQYHTARFQDLRDEYGFEPVQIVCNAADEVLFERFAERTEAGERHPGHVDHLMSCDQFAALLLEVDVTDFDTVDVEALVRAIKTWARDR